MNTAHSAMTLARHVRWLALPILFSSIAAEAQSSARGPLAGALRDNFTDEPTYAWLVHAQQRPEGVLEMLDTALQAQSDQPTVVIAPLGRRDPAVATFYAVAPPGGGKEREIAMCIEAAGAAHSYWLLSTNGETREVDPRGQSGCLIFTATRKARYAQGETSNKDLPKRKPQGDLGALLQAHYADIAARTLAECEKSAAKKRPECDVAAQFAQTIEDLRRTRAASEPILQSDND